MSSLEFLRQTLKLKAIYGISNRLSRSFMQLVSTVIFVHPFLEKLVFSFFLYIYYIFVFLLFVFRNRFLSSWSTALTCFDSSSFGTLFHRSAGQTFWFYRSVGQNFFFNPEHVVRNISAVLLNIQRVIKTKMLLQHVRWENEKLAF